MSLFSRRSLLLISAGLWVSACGFEPVHQQGAGASVLMGQVEVEQKPGRNAFELRDRLYQRVGRASGDAQYLLTYVLDIEERELVVTSTVEIIRYNLIGTASFKVTNRATGLVVFTDQVFTTTSYSATSKTFPTRVAEQNANVRLVHSLADQMFTRLSITADDWVQ